MPKIKGTVVQGVARPRNVAEYLEYQIRICGKSQFQIAEEAGFEKPNIITMLKQGKTKLPMSRIPQMAKALGVDPINLLRMTMKEYYPETWDTIEGIFGQTVLTANEQDVITLFREAKVENPKIRTMEERTRILAAFNALRPENADK